MKIILDDYNKTQSKANMSLVEGVKNNDFIQIKYGVALKANISCYVSRCDSSLLEMSCIDYAKNFPDRTVLLYLTNIQNTLNAALFKSIQKNDMSGVTQSLAWGADPTVSIEGQKLYSYVELNCSKDFSEFFLVNALYFGVIAGNYQQIRTAINNGADCSVEINGKTMTELAKESKLKPLMTNTLRNLVSIPEIKANSVAEYFKYFKQKSIVRKEEDSEPFFINEVISSLLYFGIKVKNTNLILSALSLGADPELGHGTAPLLFQHLKQQNYSKDLQSLILNAGLHKAVVNGNSEKVQQYLLYDEADCLYMLGKITILQQAEMSASPEVIFLLKKSLIIKAVLSKDFKKVKTAFELGAPALVKVADGKTLIDLVPNKSHKELYYFITNQVYAEAAFSSNYHWVDYALKCGANLDLVLESTHLTILESLMQSNGNVWMVMKLMQLGARYSYEIKEQYFQNKLIEGVYYDNIDLVQFAVSQGAKVDEDLSVGEDRISVCDYAMSNNRSLTLVTFLQQKGATFTQKIHQNYIERKMKVALDSNDLESLISLLSNGLVPDDLIEGISPIEYVIEKRLNSCLIFALVNYGAKFSEKAINDLCIRKESLQEAVKGILDQNVINSYQEEIAWIDNIFAKCSQNKTDNNNVEDFSWTAHQPIIGEGADASLV